MRHRGLGAVAVVATIFLSLACLAAREAVDAAAAPLGGPCADPPSSLRIVREGEPGTPLVVRGRVFRPDGETPAAGVILYAYQTDVTGLYHGPGDRAPRLRGWLRTGRDGSYELRTIRPAPYPQGTIAAHIHTQLWARDVSPQYGPDLLFDDDPLVTAEERGRSDALGRFGFVRRPEPEGPGFAVKLDIRLSREGSTFEDVTEHGLRDCRR